MTIAQYDFGLECWRRENITRLSELCFAIYGEQHLFIAALFAVSVLCHM